MRTIAAMVQVVSKSKDYRLLVVAPNTHYHFPLTMPHAIIPEPQFSQYPTNKFEFILGAASSLDANSNSFTATLNKGGQKAVKYDHLIIATGSYAKDRMPWKLGASAGTTLDSLHTGGGLTGIKTAGELGVRKQAVTELTKLGLKMMPKTHVTDMSSVLAQAYIPSLGLSPNTAFAPASMRNTNGYLKQMTTLQVEGHPNIFVRAAHTESQATQFTKNLSTILSGGQMLEYSVSSRKLYGFTLDRSRATGQMGRFLFIDITPALSTGERMMSNSSEKFGRGRLTSLQLFIYVVFRC
ncbi:putative apoptosis-inducing factor [Trichoderma sp. SZMC 28012]